MRLTTFLTITIFIALVMFIALMSSSRVYTTQTLLLVVPKSEISAVQAEYVIGNISALSAYKHFAKGDFPYSLSGSNRTWNGHVDVVRKEGTGIIALRTRAANLQDAVVINKAMTQSALKRISNYYNITKDINVRIIGAPTHTRTVGNIAIPALLSILAGALIATLIAGAMKLFRVLSTRTPRTRYQPRAQWTQQQYESVEPKPAYTFEGQDEYLAQKQREDLAEVGVHVMEPEVDEPQDLFEQHTQHEQHAQSTEEITQDIASVRSAQRGSAPANLPIIDASSTDTSVVEESAEELVAEIAQQERARDEALSEDADVSTTTEEVDVNDLDLEMSKGEPTDAELKERLNKLLRGDL